MEKQNNEKVINYNEIIENNAELRESVNTFFEAIKKKLSCYSEINGIPCVLDLKFSKNKSKTLIKKLSFKLTDKTKKRLGIAINGGSFLLLQSNKVLRTISIDDVWDTLIEIIEKAMLTIYNIKIEHE